MAEIETITREELKEKMDRGDDFVLAEALPTQAFRHAHLPGAINLEDLDQVSELLPDRDAEIITYCTNFN
jgi:rhodanese-related sulfurtransferase